MARQRVVAAMSGGVDSSIAAALLKQQGYEVIGITMQIWTKPVAGLNGEQSGSCCSVSAIGDARSVADKLQIPHYVLDFREQFQREVVDYFCREYAFGRTPNPCIVCNRQLKFRYLLDKALSLGAAYVATGHYARLRHDSDRNRFVLLAAKDKGKDQSYALYGLNQYQLAHTLFPLGELTKEETRAMASHLNLAVARKKDSQEICFVSDDDYRGFLRNRIPTAIKPGFFFDIKGQVLGEHQGLPFYTVGQRRHLGIASSKRLYVVDIDPKRNAVILGEEKELWRSQIQVEKVNWTSIPPPGDPVDAMVRVRYRGTPYRARVLPEGEFAAKVKFLEPARAPAPGQAAVFYDNEEVLGGGIIVK